MRKIQPDSKGLVHRVFNNLSFQLFWALFLALMLIFVSWPVRNIALVYWTYGKSGYVDRGIRVLPGKPVRFSNGEPAPLAGDLITGFGAFLITAFGATGLLVIGLKICERTKR